MLRARKSVSSSVLVIVLASWLAGLTLLLGCGNGARERQQAEQSLAAQLAAARQQARQTQEELSAERARNSKYVWLVDVLVGGLAVIFFVGVGVGSAGRSRRQQERDDRRQGGD